MFILSITCALIIAYTKACSKESKDAWCLQNTITEGSYCKYYQDQEVCQFSDTPCGCLEPSCADVCASNVDCATGDQGSYCKTWDNRNVCFGLYWTDATYTTTCYAPSDATCDITALSPVECSL